MAETKLIDHMEAQRFEVNEALGLDRQALQSDRIKAIAALRQRAADLEMMLRAALTHDLQPSGRYDCAYVLIRDKNDMRVVPASISILMENGIPILTDEARALLTPASRRALTGGKE